MSWTTPEMKRNPRAFVGFKIRKDGAQDLMFLTLADYAIKHHTLVPGKLVQSEGVDFMVVAAGWESSNFMIHYKEVGP